MEVGRERERERKRRVEAFNHQLPSEISHQTQFTLHADPIDPALSLNIKYAM